MQRELEEVVQGLKERLAPQGWTNNPDEYHSSKHPIGTEATAMYLFGHPEPFVKIGEHTPGAIMTRNDYRHISHVKFVVIDEDHKWTVVETHFWEDFSVVSV